MRTAPGLLMLCCWFATGCATPVTAPAPDPTPELLTARVYIAAPYDAVWERFSSAAGYADWYTSPCREFSLHPGDSLVWGTDEREVYRGRMRWAEKGRGLGFEFRFVGFDFEEPMTPVDIRILARGPTTLVEVEHDVTGAPETSAIISPVGWTKPISRLKTLLETGGPMAWPEEPEGAAGN